ncbi:oxidoreductase-like protein [Hypoxylon cercidicola]|nr:oxidoreductase-like protein [Hypoxylon cercidicola]
MTRSHSRSYFWHWIIPVVFLGAAYMSRDTLQICGSYFIGSRGYACPQDSYQVRIVSYSPLIIHLENFITQREREHLISLGLPLLKPSMVINKNNEQAQVPGRTSSSGFLPSDEPVIGCIRQRALSFQGYASVHLLESLQVVSYQPGQQYGAHYDWGISSEDLEVAERITTFFAILKGDCEHCGTHFPYLKVDWGSEDDQWCRLIDCEASSAKNGTVFQALEGSAVFWRNLDDAGVGDPRVLHEGMMVESGEKIGLNIWTRDG